MGRGIFIVLWMLSFASAQDQMELEPSSEIGEEPMEEIQEVLPSLSTLQEMGNNSVSEDITPSCRCAWRSCRCCKRVHLDRIRLNGEMCVGVTWLKHNNRILVKLAYIGNLLFSREVSVRNPPRICVGFPRRVRGASVCIRLVKITVGKKAIRGCARFVARKHQLAFAWIRIGCFRMNFLDAADPAESLELPYINSTVDGKQMAIVNDQLAFNNMLK